MFTCKFNVPPFFQGTWRECFRGRFKDSRRGSTHPECVQKRSIYNQSNRPPRPERPNPALAARVVVNLNDLVNLYAGIVWWSCFILLMKYVELMQEEDTDQGEDELSLAGHKAFLAAEWGKGRDRRNHGLITDRLNRTKIDRRQMARNVPPSILLEVYPTLRDIRQVQYEHGMPFHAVQHVPHCDMPIMFCRSLWMASGCLEWMPATTEFYSWQRQECIIYWGMWGAPQQGHTGNTSMSGTIALKISVKVSRFCRVCLLKHKLLCSLQYPAKCLACSVYKSNSPYFLLRFPAAQVHFSLLALPMLSKDKLTHWVLIDEVSWYCKDKMYRCCRS